MSVTIKEIAHRYGISVPTVHRIIDEHPEWGIQREERKKTVLTINQASAISAALDAKGHSDKYETAEARARAAAAETASAKAEAEADEAKLRAELAEARQQLAEVKAERDLLQATMDSKISAAESRVEMAEENAKHWREQLDKTTDQIGNQQKLLEAARDERSAAEMELNNVAAMGFFERRRWAKERRNKALGQER